MDTKTEYKLYSAAIAILAGVMYVYFLGGFVRPKQSDLTHAIGRLTADGGMVFHPAEYEIGKELFGRFTLVVTASVLPPVSGDLAIEFNGPEKLKTNISTRYPPGLPITNRSDPWYTFEDGIFKNVTSGSDLVLVIQISPPQQPGAYEMQIVNAASGQVYLNLPVIFTPEGSSIPTGEDCH